MHENREAERSPLDLTYGGPDAACYGGMLLTGTRHWLAFP